jgi:signal transduction histidine kinase
MFTVNNINNKINKKNIHQPKNSIDIHWIMNSDLNYTYVSNNIFYEFGYTPEEWLKIDIKKSKNYEAIKKLIATAVEEVHKDRFISFESQIKHRNGSFIEVEVAFKARLNKEGNADRLYGTIRNKSKEEKLGPLFILNNKINESDSVDDKDLLFSIISHNLINPFNIILGFSRMLKHEYYNFNDAERLAQINNINKYASTNYRLTKNLLDWSKLQQQGIVVKKEIINCKKFIAETIKPYLALAERKGIEIQLNINEKDVIYADDKLIHTVVANLFMNAIKFTKRNGTIKISLKLLKNLQKEIIIEDNGLGMDEEQLDKIFKISKINSKNGTENEKGTGLGLFISKKLMDYHNSSLNFSIIVNKGTKVIITL